MEAMSYVMVNVTDMAASVAFYRLQLGLKLRFETPFWSEFETGATTLALHGGSPKAAPGPRNAAGTCTFGFSVPDLDATYAKLSAAGVKFAQEPQDRPDEGIRLAIAVDPDGLPISLSQVTRPYP